MSEHLAFKMILTAQCNISIVGNDCHLRVVAGFQCCLLCQTQLSVTDRIVCNLAISREGDCPWTGSSRERSLV